MHDSQSQNTFISPIEQKVIQCRQRPCSSRAMLGYVSFEIGLRTLGNCRFRAGNHRIHAAAAARSYYFCCPRLVESRIKGIVSMAIYALCPKLIDHRLLQVRFQQTHGRAGMCDVCWHVYWMAAACMNSRRCMAAR